MTGIDVPCDNCKTYFSHINLCSFLQGNFRFLEPEYWTKFSMIYCCEACITPSISSQQAAGTIHQHAIRVINIALVTSTPLQHADNCHFYSIYKKNCLHIISPCLICPCSQPFWGELLTYGRSVLSRLNSFEGMETLSFGGNQLRFFQENRQSQFFPPSIEGLKSCQKSCDETQENITFEI